MLRTLLCLLLIAVSPAPTFAADVAGSAAAKPARTPVPSISIENPGKCIAPADEMRRNHMEMLKHQRDRTMRQGIRGEKVTLNGCIECHASKTTGSVLGAKADGTGENFCQACHSYAAVKLDCFECHQPKANFKAAATVTGAKP
jgi:hypothetical protein